MSRRHARKTPHHHARGMRIGVLAASLLIIPGLTYTAVATDPLFVNTTALLPSTESTYNPASNDECIAGKATCIDKMISDFRTRFKPLAKACSHDAPFAMMYLRVSQTYRWSLANKPAGYYDDKGWMNHVVAVFGTYYTKAYDNWAKGNLAQVPIAWQIAYDASTTKLVSTEGNLLLGANAHINRDLAFSMAAAGLVAPDTRSGKHDYDQVNDLISTVIAPLDAETATRFDPKVDDDADSPGQTSYVFTAQLMNDWREQAWRNAERLVAAKTDADRALVAAQIEAYAEGVAQSIKEAYKYPNGKGAQDRDRWCQANYRKAGPLPYAFGYAPAF